MCMYMSYGTVTHCIFALYMLYLSLYYIYTYIAVYKTALLINVSKLYGSCVLLISVLSLLIISDTVMISRKMPTVVQVFIIRSSR